MKYKYDLVWSVRRSISITISAENKITVRCPWGVSKTEVEQFLSNKENWIEKVVLKNSEKLTLNDDIVEYRKIYVCGKKLDLVFSDRNAFEGGTVYIKTVKDIEKLFISEFYVAFAERLKAMEEKTKLISGGVFIKDYKSRWGCCDAKNILTFNFRIFMLPQDLQEYIMLHELCHTLCHNHSPAYWKLVKGYMPDYENRRLRLKSFDFLVSLYSRIN